VAYSIEKFDQAIKDYTSGLTLKQELLPLSSRHIAEAHYRLSLVLDMTPGKLSDAIVQIEKALESVEARLSELHMGLNRNEEHIPPAPSTDWKGKGKMVDLLLLKGDMVQNMRKSDIEAEIREMEGLRSDLVLKASYLIVAVFMRAHGFQQVEEMKTASNEVTPESAPVLAAKALDDELNAAATATLIGSEQVNDLTSIVKKKKKASDVNGREQASNRKGTGKRRADEEYVEASPSDKKLKLES
jgi:HAT1-interacting factor 1